MKPQLTFWPERTVSAPERPALDDGSQPGVDAPTIDAKPVKLGIRIRGDLSVLLATRARECGLSQAAYLSNLIAGSPAPSLEVVVALGSSTDRLATVSADLNEVIRVFRRDSSSSAPLVEQLLKPLTSEVREHLRLASRLVSELRPARTRSNPRRGTATGKLDGD
jgi:hypothetical protein